MARIEDAQRPVTDAAGSVTTTTSTVHSYLLGLRHLSERDTTTILEYYRNGTGYTKDEMRSFSVTPELLYTGITNVELRLRAFFLAGRAPCREC